ncbi:MAG: hypothetical protein ACM3ZU_13525 [Bacteroidota bacterium]
MNRRVVLGALFASLVLAVSGCVVQPRKQQTSVAATMLPEIRAFLDQYPEYGKVVAVTSQPDWVKGRRQTITTRTNGGLRDYLFYTEQGQVQTVYALTEDQGRVIVWGETESHPMNAQEEPIARPAVNQLPAYTILLSVDLADGTGRMGDILIPSLSPSTPRAKRESVARAIAAKEGFVAAYLYSTREAYEADMSSSYAKAHPDALKSGFLGFLEQGKFMP